MPIWPFKRRRRSVTKDDSTQPLNEKEQAQTKAQAQAPVPTRAATYPPTTPSAPIDVPRKASKRGNKLRKRQISREEGQWAGSEKPTTPSDKENVPPHHRVGSREDITALPMSKRLESSPHLRPVDFEKPPIPYNFRTYSGSQTSIQREPDISSPNRPNTLRSRRSGYESVPSRKQSSKRRKDDQLREEEIRAMSAQMPIPKRAGDGPLRRDSKKMRGLGVNKDSNVSLPPAEDSIISMSAIVEQRGWEIGSIDVFNPRPAVRLSGTPQYVAPGSLPTMPSSPLSSEYAGKDKEKMPESRESARKRDTIGNRADDFDAADLRRLLERDDKRKEKRKKDQNDKLDKKLRSRGGRNRGDSDRRRREAEEARREAELALRADEARRIRELEASQSAIHPALRGQPSNDQSKAAGATAVTAAAATAIGVAVTDEQADPGASESEDPHFETPFETPSERPVDPFADPVIERDNAPTPTQERHASEPTSAVSRDVAMEDSTIGTAKEMRLSQTVTPPLSPIQTARAQNSLSQVLDSRPASDLVAPAPITDQRRVSDPKPERRAGAWAMFFRRGGTKLQKPDDVPTETGFVNTSREARRNQPIPAHLIDTQAPPPRGMSVAPARTQSKFREDLPEMPISPPDSRMPSPDVTNAAAVAAARRAARSSALSQDTNMAESESGTRSDSPVTTSQHRITSMASIDSEGSWLASGSAKRTSTQSGLNQRRPDFVGSYEELGMDRDAVYVNRPLSSGAKISSPTLGGHDPDEESGEDEPAGVPPGPDPDPMTMHESVRRKPTLVHRDPRVKSREGLLTEFVSNDSDNLPGSAGSGGRGSIDFDPEEPEPELHRASSVGYGKNHAPGHARQISAGSAKLFDVPARSPTSPAFQFFTSNPKS